LAGFKTVGNSDGWACAPSPATKGYSGRRRYATYRGGLSIRIDGWRPCTSVRQSVHRNYLEQTAIGLLVTAVIVLRNCKLLVERRLRLSNHSWYATGAWGRPRYRYPRALIALANAHAMP
jgi:hypothetical protein